ncbi:MAG: CBS domain-containing protein [Planctomycetes bacterium]|nr:CBS domain-containing protein [Planctomycetota bacterium]
MQKNAAIITADKTIAEAVELMVDRKTNGLVVIDGEGKPVGVVSSYTLLKEVVPAYLKGDPTFSQYDAEGVFDRYAARAKDKKIGEIMNGGLHVLSETDAMIEAAAYALEATRRTLPVVDNDGKLVGVMTRTGIKKALYDAIRKGSGN